MHMETHRVTEAALRQLSCRVKLEKVDVTCNISPSASVLPCCVSQADTSTKHWDAHKHIYCHQIPPQHIHTICFLNLQWLNSSYCFCKKGAVTGNSCRHVVSLPC